MKNVTFILIIALAMTGALIASNSPMQQNRSAELLLGTALHQEEVEGDLETAIETYRKVLAEYSNIRPVAAKALLRIGQCYERLGKDEARKAYQQLVSDYADQSEQAELARVRLAALSKTSDDNKKPVFATRQVLVGPSRSFLRSSTSPDGRYLSFRDRETGDLAVRDLRTGAIRRLTNEDPLGAGVESSKWSPDGKYIAYIWDKGPYVDLRVISAEGGKSRILVDNKAEGEPMQVSDWSADSNKILAWLEKEDGTQQMLLVSSSDGTTKVLKTFEIPSLIDRPKNQPQVARFSRDGQYIVYDWPQEKGVPERDIFVISTDGKRESPLVHHPADDYLLGWPPNGESILFASDRHGSLDMWLQKVSGGKAQGLPVLIKKGVDRIVPLGFTKDRVFYYTLQELQGIDIYGARIDFRSGKLLAPPEVIIKRNGGKNIWPDYSPDGKYLAYLTAQNRHKFDYNTLCIRSLENDKEREFTTRFRLLSNTQWAPDSQSIYLTAWDDQGAEIYRVNAQTGEFAPIVRNNIPQATKNSSLLYRHKVTPDGKIIVYLRCEPPGPYRIIARNLITGEEEQLYSGTRPVYFSISPDGQRLALITGPVKRKVLQIMSMNSGRLKDLLQFEDNRASSAIEWTPDGKYILFQGQHPSKDYRQAALWWIAAEGGEPQKLNLPMDAFYILSAHPDGQHLVLGTVGFELESTTGIWIMENFLPK